MKKSIDILLITYNQEQYTRQAIEGILMQRVSSDYIIRIIVADDGSSDLTLASIRNILSNRVQLEDETFAEVVYLPSNQNVGHVRNYQRAFDACKGDYVAILEGDDYWSSPLHLQTHVNFLENHRECVLTTQRPTWYFEDQKRFEPTAITKFEGAEYKYVTIDEEIRENKIVNLSSCVVRGSAIRNLDERIFTCLVLDWPMYVNLSQMGLLCILTGTSNVYRAKSSGLYAGLQKEDELKIDERLLCEIENIFPQYKEGYKQARNMIHPKPKSLRRKVLECILWPFAKMGKLCHKVSIVYNKI